MNSKSGYCSKIGYTTGTFDLLHPGHLQQLKFMKQQCTFLIVGLTTDELAIQQKRKPYFTYEHRHALLSATKYVNAVVAHQGDSKDMAWRKLKFHILFIGDDYYDTEEYKSFIRTPVIFLPRIPNVSTSQLVTNFQNSIVDSMSILTYGLFGPILRLGNEVIKIIRIGADEEGNTKDVYKIADPVPRNWEWEKKRAFPNLSGINTNRELMIYYYLGCQWFLPETKMVLAFHEENSWNRTDCTGIRKALAQRRFPQSAYFLIQNYAGQSMQAYLSGLEKDYDVKDEVCVTAVNYLTEQLELIFNILQKHQVVHGDVHLRNICVNDNGQINLIDWGWCLHPLFELGEFERSLWSMRLSSNFDRMHLIKSSQDKGVLAKKIADNLEKNLNKN